MGEVTRSSDQKKIPRTGFLISPTPPGLFLRESTPLDKEPCPGSVLLWDLRSCFSRFPSCLSHPYTYILIHTRPQHFNNLNLSPPPSPIRTISTFHLFFSILFFFYNGEKKDCHISPFIPGHFSDTSRSTFLPRELVPVSQHRHLVVLFPPPSFPSLNPGGQ